MTHVLLGEMGPVDYVVLEWPGRQPEGEVAPLIIDLVGAIDFTRRSGPRHGPASRPRNVTRLQACDTRRAPGS